VFSRYRNASKINKKVITRRSTRPKTATRFSSGELSVVLREGESPEAGAQEAYELMAKLGLENSQLIEGAYVDLLSKTGLQFSNAGAMP